jgi:hypothetical protein
MWWVAAKRVKGKEEKGEGTTVGYRESFCLKWLFHPGLNGVSLVSGGITTQDKSFAFMIASTLPIGHVSFSLH